MDKYFFMILSLIVFLASVIWLIYSIVKKKPKKVPIAIIILSGIISVFLFLSAGTIKIDKKDPLGTSLYIAYILGIEDDEVEEYYGEWEGGNIKKTYTIGGSEDFYDSYATVVLDENEKQIDQINIHNISDDEAIDIISSSKIPFVSSIEDVLVLPDPGAYARKATFVTHEGTGLLLVVDNFEKEINEDTENMLIISYNPESFDYMKEYENKINEKNK